MLINCQQFYALLKLFLKRKNEKKSSLIILNYLYSFYFPLYSMYQLNAMAFYMLHFLRIKASVNIFNVNIKLKMPPMKRILDLKDSHQQSMLCYLPSKRLKTNNKEKENNTVKSLFEQVTPSKSNLWKFNSRLSKHVKGLSEILILKLNNHYNVAF